MAEFPVTKPEFVVPSCVNLSTYIQGMSDYEVRCYYTQLVQQWATEWAQMQTEWSSQREAFESLKQYVNNKLQTFQDWFDNLDVQQEINNTLQSMYEDGTLADAIAQTNTVQSTITDWLNQNVTPTGSAVVVDKSLSVEGAAADAKSTGDTFKRSYQVYNDSVTNIDNLFKPGTYHLTKASLGEHFSELNIQESSESATFYSMLVLAPSTLTNYIPIDGVYDVTQVLVLNGKKQSVFIRNSIYRKFSKFIEVCNNGARRAFNANVYPNPATLDFYDVGIYTPAYSAVREYVDELGETNGWYSLINIAPVEVNLGTNTDFHNIYQMLVQCDNVGQTIWHRQRYISGTTEYKTKWTLLNSYKNPTYRSVFDNKLVDVNSLLSKVGTFRISTDSLLTNKAGIELSDDDIKSYYWTVISIGQVTDGSYTTFDTAQFLIGVSIKNDGTRYLYYRDSYTQKFNEWNLLYTNVNSPEPTPLHSPQKVLFMGDSFTHDYSNTDYGVISYTRYLELMGNYDCTNEAIDGASATSWYATYNNKITADYDTFFVAFGLNNDPNGTGVIDDGETSNTFAGSMQAIIKKIYEVNPAARIIIWCMDAWYQKDKSDMAKQIADKYGCEYHSMKADATIPVRIDGKFQGVIPTLDSTYVETKTLSLCQSKENHHPTSVAQYQLATYLKTVI